MKNIKTVLGREILAFMNNPAMYISLITFLLVWQFLFFRNVFLIGEASIRTLFDIFPWLLALFAGSVTMGVLANESEQGTIELVLTHPVSELEYLLGKFLGSVIYTSIALVTVVPIVLGFSNHGGLDYGVVFIQLVSSFLLIIACVSLGLFVSSLFSGQIAALLLTVISLFFLNISGTDFISQVVPQQAAYLLQDLSLFNHYQSMARGVLTAGDVLYFLSFTAVFVFLTYLQLLKRKYGNLKSRYIKYQAAVISLVILSVLIAVLGYQLPGRLDLTKTRAYTLSAASSETVKGLKDIVTITLYASKKIPAQYVPVLRETKDLLRDYKQLGGSNIVLKIVDPSAAKTLEQEALNLGISAVRFNVIGQEEFQSNTGYMGIVLSYAGKSEVIPFVKSTSDLEYQLTTSLRKLTSPNLKTIGILSGHNERTLETELTVLVSELSKQFEVITVAFSENAHVIPGSVTTLIVPGPALPLTDIEKTEISNFIQSGKNVIFYVDNHTIQVVGDNVIAQPLQGNISEFLTAYGVTVNNDIVYDLKLRNTIRLGDNQMTFMVPYSYWVKALPGTSSDIPFLSTGDLGTVFMPWASSINVDTNIAAEKGYTVKTLLNTSAFGGTVLRNENLNPSVEPPSTSLGAKTLGVVLEPLSAQADLKPGKIVVLGTSELITDYSISSSVSNLVFNQGLVSWLAQEPSLAAIKSKGAISEPLLFSNPLQPALIKYGTMGLSVLLPTIIGVLRLYKRKRDSYRTYES